MNGERTVARVRLTLVAIVYSLAMVRYYGEPNIENLILTFISGVYLLLGYMIYGATKRSCTVRG